MPDVEPTNAKSNAHSLLPTQSLARRTALRAPALQLLAVALGAAASIAIGAYAAHRHNLNAVAPAAAHVAASSAQGSPPATPEAPAPNASNVSVTVQGKPVLIPPGTSRQVIHGGSTTTVIDTQQSHTGENSTTQSSSSVSVTVNQTTQEGGETTER